MIRTIAALALVGIGLTPFVDKSDTPALGKLQAVDTMETSSMTATNRIVYDVAGPSGANCRIFLEKLPTGMYSLKADVTCADVHSGLERVAYWTDFGNGSVRLEDDAHMTVLSLGASDGFAYESVSPSTALVTFAEVQG
jgi:hypothetical protein